MSRVCVPVFVCFLTTELKASVLFDLRYSWPASVDGCIPLAESEALTFRQKTGSQAEEPSEGDKDP